MKIATKSVPREPLAELQEALKDAHRPPDPVLMDKACKDMDRMRKELRNKVGDLDVAVELIREARNP